MATATKNATAANLNETLLTSWSEGLERVFTAQTELEELVLQAIENQKESFGKLDGDIAKIQEEQRKLIEDIREQTKLNLQKVFGQSATKVFDQLNAQFDEVSNRVQDLTVQPYKEGVSLINQTQDQFKQSLKGGFEQQQKVREEFKNQIKTTQQLYFDFYEANSKIALGLFK
jgi:Polyhydroxyalkanoic acid inclusion protein (PhaP_Bmeg)